MSREPVHEMLYTIKYECGKCGWRYYYEASVPEECEFTDLQGRCNIAMNRCKQQATNEGWSTYGSIRDVCPKCMARVREIEARSKKMVEQAEMEKDRKWWRG